MHTIPDWYYYLLTIIFYTLPFITLYLWQKLKKLSVFPLNQILKEVGRENIQEVKLVKGKQMNITPDGIDLDYVKLLDAYGSLKNYEDLVMKDFETMRKYLYKNVEMLDNFSQTLYRLRKTIDEIKDVSDYLEVKVAMSEVLAQIEDEFTRTAKHIENYIEQEKEAHGEGHEPEEIKERRNKDE